ncbi:hypothetical protein G6F57_022887 [Rhizopus arrhizus]|nr:hypothetical protein G6F57_022887 [Rhizopus arrhizus]
MLARDLHDDAGHRRHGDANAQVAKRDHDGERPVGHVRREGIDAGGAHDGGKGYAAQQRRRYVPARRNTARDHVADGEHGQHGHQLDAG